MTTHEKSSAALSPSGGRWARSLMPEFATTEEQGEGIAPDVRVVDKAGRIRPLVPNPSKNATEIREQVHAQIRTARWLAVHLTARATSSPWAGFAVAAAAMGRKKLVAIRDGGRPRAAKASEIVGFFAQPTLRLPQHSFYASSLGSQYELLGYVDSGSASEVCRARDVLTDEIVAIKYLRRGLEGTAQLRREAVALRGLDLPGVVRLVEHGHDQDRLMLVTEWVDGLPFPGDRKGWEAIRAPTLALLQTLATVHAQGIIHGDLKPANILVGTDGRVTILDFGLSHGIGLGAGTHSSSAYSPPEASLGRLDVRSDIFAVGITLFQALQREDEVPHGADPWETTPQPVRDLIHRMQSEKPEDRPGSALEIYRVLAGAWDPRLTRLVAEAGADLEALFEGPNRVVHLQEDAAAELRRRTDGQADLVLAELRAWLDLGMAHWGEHALRLKIDAIERLRQGLLLPIAPNDLPAPADEDLLNWVEVAGMHATLEVLHHAMGESEDALQERLQRLGDAKLVVCLQAGWWRVIGPSAGWSPARRREVQAILAPHLAESDPHRLLHLDLESEDLVTAVLALARRDGRLSSAYHMLENTLLVMGDHGASSRVQTALLRALAYAAVDFNNPVALHRALHHLGRAQLDALSSVEKLVQSALDTLGTRSTIAVATLKAEMEDEPEFQVWRRVVLARAANKVQKRDGGELFEECVRWARGHESPDVRARGLLWEGHRAYLEGKYEEARKYYAEAHTVAEAASIRLDARQQELVATLELDLDATVTLAEQAIVEARENREPLLEGRAEAFRRAALYRLGRASEVDRELVDGWIEFGDPEAVGVGCLNEAAVAWRSGNLGDARRLALEARNGMRDSGSVGGPELATALAARCGEPVSPADVLRVAAGARECNAEVGLQALTLLRQAGVLQDWPDVARFLAERAAVNASNTVNQRLDVLSINECLSTWITND